MDKMTRYPDAPLNETEWKTLDETAIEAARRQLVGRRFIDLYGPLGPGVQSVPNDLYENWGADGEIDLLGDALSLASPARRVQLPIPMIYKDFVLYWRDIEQAKTLDMPIDTTPAAYAATECARLEDDLIFNGSKKFDLPGLMNVPNRLVHVRGDWEKSGQAFEDIVQAINKLIQKGHTGPYALVVSPRLHSLLRRVHENSNVLEIERVRDLMTEGVYQSPAIQGDKGVIVSTGIHNLDLTIAEDFQSAYLGNEQMNHLFRIYACVVLRIKRPSAICVLEEANG